MLRFEYGGRGHNYVMYKITCYLFIVHGAEKAPVLCMILRPIWAPLYHALYVQVLAPLCGG